MAVHCKQKNGRSVRRVGATPRVRVMIVIALLPWPCRAGLRSSMHPSCDGRMRRQLFQKLFVYIPARSAGARRHHAQSLPPALLEMAAIEKISPLSPPRNDPQERRQLASNQEASSWGVDGGAAISSTRQRQHPKLPRAARRFRLRPATPLIE